jgi:hypothetical protein
LLAENRAQTDKRIKTISAKPKFQVEGNLFFCQKRKVQNNNVKTETHLKTKSSVNQKGTGVTGIRVTKGMRAIKRNPVNRHKVSNGEDEVLEFMRLF